MRVGRADIKDGSAASEQDVPAVAYVQIPLLRGVGVGVGDRRMGEAERRHRRGMDRCRQVRTSRPENSLLEIDDDDGTFAHGFTFRLFRVDDRTMPVGRSAGGALRLQNPSYVVAA